MTDLIKAMAEVNDLNRTHGVTQRGGKKYTEVFVRIEAFRKAFGTDMGIETNIMDDNGQRVIVQAVIKNKDGMIIGSGFAEEIRGSSNVNKTSAIENGETSAIGRALASIGLHGGSYASANELVAAKRKETALDEIKKEEEESNKETMPQNQAQWVAWCTDLTKQYQQAKSKRDLAEVDRKTDDAWLDQLKSSYPELFQRLVKRLTEKENSFEQ
tara:strand:- start:542 stop:1183 length:642 start_codon:yes stop_codon:yes gene_type:complete